MRLRVDSDQEVSVDQVNTSLRLAIVVPFALTIALWSYVVCNGNGFVDTLGNPIGGDFPMFYIAGETAANGQWSRLYDDVYQHRRLLELHPGIDSESYLPFRYPPIVALAMSPLGATPYHLAYIAYSLLTIAMWLLTIYAFVKRNFDRTTSAERTSIWAIVLAPVAFQSFIDGQASMLWFAIAAWTWMLLSANKPAVAGMIFSLAVFKPNAMLLLGVVWLIRYPRMLIGLIPSVALLLMISIGLVGAGCMNDYIQLAKQLALNPWTVETPLAKVESLIVWTNIIAGAHARMINAWIGMACAIAIGVWWRRSVPGIKTDTIALSIALVSNALFNPYTPVYDLTIVCLAGLSIIVYLSRTEQLETMLGSSNWRALFATLLFGPIVSQKLAAYCGLQFFPLALLAISIAWIVQQARLPACDRRIEWIN